MSSAKDISEIFGHDPRNLSPEVRKLWNFGACPFIGMSCTKYNHDQTVIYGTCSVASTNTDVIICPNRLYANDYATIRRVSADAFGAEIKFYFFDDFVKTNTEKEDCVVALGHNSGKEVKLGKALSMDWVLARVKNNLLVEYVGVEVQSIDITGNYRDTWHAYKNFSAGQTRIPESEHGFNWANVHKRLIPQIIRKGVIYSKSRYCKKGMYFVLPEVVYEKFEGVVGSDLEPISIPTSETLTVFTYKLGPKSSNSIRELLPVRTVRFSLDEFANRFISSPNLPKAVELDSAIKRILNIT